MSKSGMASREGNYVNLKGLPDAKTERVLTFRNLTGGITEVTITEPLFHIAHLWCLRNPLFQWYALRRVVRMTTATMKAMKAPRLPR